MRRPPHPGNIQPSLVFSFSLSAASRATSSACRSRCGTGTPSSTAFSKIESDSLTIYYIVAAPVQAALPVS